MKRSFVLGTLLAALAVALPTIALAQGVNPPAADSSTVLPNPLGDAVTPAEIARRIVRTLLGVTGIVALLVFMFGGVQYMLSGGNSQKVQKAKDTIVYATLGLAIVFASYSLLQFLLRFFSGATGAT